MSSCARISLFHLFSPLSFTLNNLVETTYYLCACLWLRIVTILLYGGIMRIGWVDTYETENKTKLYFICFCCCCLVLLFLLWFVCFRTTMKENRIWEFYQCSSNGKESAVMQKTRVHSLGQEDPLEKGMAIHSSILAWRIPWTEEPGGLQFVGSQRVGHNWVTNARSPVFSTISPPIPFLMRVMSPFSPS